jgi:membrane glycosyltransferase
MFTLSQISPRVVTRRRVIFFSICTLLFALGFLPMVSILAGRGWGPFQLLVLGLFAILFAQVAFGMTLSLVGFWVLRRGGDPLRINRTLPPEGRRAPLPSTAIVMPIYNEEVSRVFQGIRVMFESLARTGRGEDFDFFLLSDSTDTNHWIEEERSWLELCKQVNGFSRIFYRKRRVRLNHKSGNVADFCRRWGANYRYMIVLDADSIMTGPTLVRMVELMEYNRSIGILQTAPQLVLGKSLFRRVQQFAARLYGPLFMAGANFWHLGGGNYWGHNAIIRLRLFMEHCALPELPKVGPLGGRILSHDTIEAALMRRAGFGVWFAYDLEGSYEEGPPELVSSLKRDRRWCQGNIQHLLLLFRKGFRFSSRIHIALGILSYASSPIWLFSLLVTALAIFWHGAPSQTGFHTHLWQKTSVKSELLFAYVAFLLLLPKFLGLAHLARTRYGVQAMGGWCKAVSSVFAEIVFSMILAPILMLFYTKFVFASLTGLPVKWGGQKRGDERPSWGELLSLLGVQTLAALTVWGVMGWLQPGWLPWLAPVLAGLTLAIPFARLTSSTKLGEAARNRGWFLIPEETQPPIELRRLDEPFLTRQGPFFDQPEYAREFGLLQAVLDPYVHAIHVSLLRLRDQVSEKAREYSKELEIKLLALGPSSLTPEERNTLLWDADALMAAHRRLWISPSGDLDPWWQHALRHYNESTAIATRRTVLSQQEQGSSLPPSGVTSLPQQAVASPL